MTLGYFSDYENEFMIAVERVSLYWKQHKKEKSRLHMHTPVRIGSK